MPSNLAGEISTGLGMTIPLTSPRPIAAPALIRSASIFCISALLPSSSAGLSPPVTPSLLASMIIIGMAMSMHVSSTPSITSLA
ncbi:hypothetical protein D3C78_1899680 [compost metagenome]